MENLQIDYTIKFTEFPKIFEPVTDEETKKLDLRFLRFTNDVFNSVVMNLNITDNLLEAFEFLQYAFDQANIWVNYDKAVYRKYGRLIQVLLKRIARLSGASRFDLHVFRCDAYFNVSLPY